MIRPAAVADAPAIMALWNEVISSTTATFTTQEKSAEDVLALVQSDWPVLVAEMNGAFAGFAALSTFRAGPGYARVAEHTIYLKAEARGTGLGRQLLQVLEQAARTDGFETLIGAISGSNPNAIAFHTCLGFEQVGLLPAVGRKWDQKIDLVLMQKNL